MAGKNSMSNLGGRLQPQATELEESVLGALMIDKEAINTVIDILHPESFYKDANQEIYRAIKDLFANSQPIDMLTVTQQLRKFGSLERVGGASYVLGLTTSTNSASNIEFHSRVIVEQSIKREMIRIAIDIQRDAFDDTTDIFDLLDQSEQRFFQVSENNIRKNYSVMSNLLRKTITEIEEKRHLKDGLTGIPSGFLDLDRITAGFQKSDLVIIAARPAMGKTAFSLSLLRNAALDFNHPVAFFSLEMSETQIATRLISGEAELESDKLKRGTLADYEWQQLKQKTIKLGEAPIFIDDTAALSILELRAKCRRLKAQHDIQLIVVDYLQLMTAGSGKNSPGNREQEISTISRGLKNLAKELNVPVIALSQLSRAVETRGGDKRPQLSDLRESGSIEQDADMVMFLYRPEYYGITEDMNGNPTKDVGEVIIAKHRNGSLDTVQLRFVGKFTRFENLDNFGVRANGQSDSKIVTFSSKANDPQQFNNAPQNIPARLDDEPPF